MTLHFNKEVKKPAVCKICGEEFFYTKAKKYKDICGICITTRKHKNKKKGYKYVK